MKNGLELYKKGLTQRINDKIYFVFGKEDKYTVFLDGTRVSCTCKFFSIHGATTPRLCKHIYAAIFTAQFYMTNTKTFINDNNYINIGDNNERRIN